MLEWMLLVLLLLLLLSEEELRELKAEELSVSDRPEQHLPWTFPTLFVAEVALRSQDCPAVEIPIRAQCVFLPPPALLPTCRRSQV